LQNERRDDPRLSELRSWLRDELRLGEFGLAPASADASFRRYFRITRKGGPSLVAMDAPPDREDLAPYLRVAEMLGEIGVHAPRVLERNIAGGFLLLTDLGSLTYLRALQSGGRADRLYGDAIDALVGIQVRGAQHARQLPAYDARLLRFEMGLFPDWLLTRHLGLALDPDEAARLAHVMNLLTESALAQPRVFVHRDYHSRNLMVCPGANPGILDFQDAVYGPLTYDLVSLLRDCYIAWPAEQVREWVAAYCRRAEEQGLGLAGDDAQFARWFDLMCVQRHLKTSGIFCRLWHRDGKPGYLNDIPRTLGYVREAAARHAELASLVELLDERVLPALAERCAGTAS
jgi:aminoglycoside/choline kinase family phosphotransferase